MWLAEGIRGTETFYATRSGRQGIGKLKPVLRKSLESDNELTAGG